MIRQARAQDLPRIMAIYDAARWYMRQTGNPTQWGDNYPPEPMLRQDIACGRLFVMEDAGGVYAVFAFLLGDDPTYTYIEGAWRDDSAYGTLHRLGSDGTHHGVFAESAAWAAERCPHLRADTHADNLTMQRCLEREGFIRCGTIYVEDGTPRVAFERITQRRNDMDPIFEIELGECPICRGAGVMQDEQGWSVSVSCMDCGAETADAEYRTPEERLESARRVALLWNMGKVIHNGMSD